MSDDSDRPAVRPVAESFSPEDVVNRPRWDTIEAKAHLCSSFVRQLRQAGYLMREIRGPHAARMRVLAEGHEREVLMFGSNNYLGLANEPEVVEQTIAAIRAHGSGLGGPPLLNGYTELHRRLEERLARIKGCQDALLFSSGFAANLGWCTALLDRGDVLVHDSLCHASLLDAIKLGDFDARPFRHNSVDSLRRALMKVRWKHPYTNLIVYVEGVYSMDGDVAPLPEVRRLCSKYGALLALDDAHGLGVLGRRGFGAQEHFDLEGQIDIVMGTFSKSLAAAGGFVAASREIVDYLRLYARPYMFSASLPPATVAHVLAALDFLEGHPERVQRLHDNVQYMSGRLARAGFAVAGHTAVIPLLVPPQIDIMTFVRRLFEEGVFVNGISYPAVPKSMQRLRISLMATFERQDLDFAVDKLTLVGRELGVVA